MTFSFIAQVSAQSAIGIRSGIVNTWPDYGDVQLPEDAKTNVRAYNVALLYSYQFNRFLRIGVEPGYIKRGAACVPGWQPIFQGDTEVFLDYVDIPFFVSGHYNIAGSEFKVMGKIGLGTSYLLAAQEQLIPLNPDQNPTTSEIDLSNDELYRWDFGNYTGLGLSYTINKQYELFAESSFYYGLRDFDKSSTSKSRSLSFNLGLNYLFRH